MIPCIISKMSFARAGDVDPAVLLSAGDAVGADQDTDTGLRRIDARRAGARQKRDVGVKAVEIAVFPDRTRRVEAGRADKLAEPKLVNTEFDAG